jgi:tetratricopeptide (TPR) repeat protein
MTESNFMEAGFGELSVDEGLCLNALELATRGKLTDAYRIVEGIDVQAQKHLRREFALLCIAIESAFLGVKGRYEEAAKKTFTILGELERSVFRTRLAWLYSTAGFWLGVLGDPERGLEWSSKALAQRELEAQSASQFALLCNHGSLLGMLDRFEESIPFFLQASDEKLHSSSNEKYVGVYNLAFCWLEWARQSTDSVKRRERAENAVRLAEIAIAAAPNTSNFVGGAAAISTYCSALVLLGEYEKAKASLAATLQVDSIRHGTQVELMVCMAQTLRSMHDLKGAVAWLDKAESLAQAHRLELGL